MAATAETYVTHPLAGLIPAMNEDEYTKLREDIESNGLRVPILLYRGQVLDGRHRLRACEALGLAPTFERYEGDEPAAFVLSLNLHRRHLSVSQRAMIATDFLPALTAEARERQVQAGREHGRGIDSPAPFGAELSIGGRASHQAAAIVGTSPRVIERAKRVIEEAPDLAPAVRAGDLTVNAAHEVVARKQKELALENGRLASGRTVQRIADQAASLELAVGAIPLHKSCDRLTADERAEAIEKCKKGRKAITALVNALLAASERTPQ